MEQDKACEHDNPSRFERLKHALGIYTCDAVNVDDRSPAEARMIRKMHEVGRDGFLILRSAEMPIRQYTRPDEKK